MGLSLAAGTVLQILVVRALRNGEALLNDEITSSSQGSRSSSRSAEMSSESFAVPNDLAVLAFVGRMYDGTPAPEPPVRPLVLPFFLTFRFLAPFALAAFFLGGGAGAGELMRSLEYLSDSSRVSPQDSLDNPSVLEVDRALRALGVRVRWEDAPDLGKYSGLERTV